MINKKYTFKLKLTANVIPATLRFHSQVIKFDFRKEFNGVETKKKTLKDQGTSINNTNSFLSTQVLKITNEGNSDVICFTSFKSNVFEISPLNFTIACNDTQQLVVSFNPSLCPINEELEENVDFYIENGNPVNLKLFAFVPNTQIKINYN